MPLTTAFLDTCRTKVQALTELTAFRTAGALAGSATRAGRGAQWAALYAEDATGTSVAYRLKKAIRDTINAQADIYGATTGTISLLERESAYQTISGEVVPTADRPPSDAGESAELIRAINEDYLS